MGTRSNSDLFPTGSGTPIKDLLALPHASTTLSDKLLVILEPQISPAICSVPVAELSVVSTFDFWSGGLGSRAGCQICS